MTDVETIAPALAAAPADMPRVLALSVVIPVYNSELTLPDLCTRLAATLPALASVYEAIPFFRYSATAALPLSGCSLL